ncbi:MAG: cytidine deaminase, partial [Ktedonobacterales bacterium]
MSIDRDSLLAAAREAALHAYAPYSHFRVGAAVVVASPDDDSPRIITGANIENASYGLTLCAERAALAAAFAQSDTDGIPPRITHVAVVCRDAPDDGSAASRSPCGACRQWFAELAPDATYYIDGIAEDLRLPDLLPYAFKIP